MYDCKVTYIQLNEVSKKIIIICSSQGHQEWGQGGKLPQGLKGPHNTKFIKVWVPQGRPAIIFHSTVLDHKSFLLALLAEGLFFCFCPRPGPLNSLGGPGSSHGYLTPFQGPGSKQKSDKSVDALEKENQELRSCM